MDKALNESTNISTLEASDVNMPEAGEKLEANDNIDDFEVDIEDLKSQLGLHELFSSMESMKSLISQVTASKRPASEPLVANLAKRSLAAAADESQQTMREFVNPSYRSLCSRNTPPGKWLFGDELPKQIKEIAEVNKMAKKLGPSQTSPGTRRGDRRNTSGRGSSFNQGQGRKVYFLGSRNRSNTTHNRRDPKSNPHSWTATKQHSSQ